MEKVNPTYGLLLRENTVYFSFIRRKTSVNISNDLFWTNEFLEKIAVRNINYRIRSIDGLGNGRTRVHFRCETTSRGTATSGDVENTKDFK